MAGRRRHELASNRYRLGRRRLGEHGRLIGR